MAVGGWEARPGQVIASTLVMRVCTYSSHSKLTFARELLGVECALVNINNFVLLGAKTATKPIVESLLIRARDKGTALLEVAGNS